MLRAAFGYWPRTLDGHDLPQFFDWKHIANPLGRSIMVVAEADRAVIGFAAWQRWPMRAGERELEALRGVDVAVAPSHQGRGLHPELVRNAADQFPEQASLILSDPNTRSLRGSLRVGRIEIGTFPLLLRIHKPLRAGFRLIAATNHPEAQGTAAAEALHDSDDVSALLAAADESNGRLGTARDVGYLRWRYGSVAAYRAVRVERGGSLGGIAIFRTYSRGRLRICKICELLVPRDEGQLGRRLLQDAMRAAAADCVTCHFPTGSTPHRAAIRSGFVRLRHGPAPTVGVLKTGVVPDPTKRASWALTLGDFDLI